MSITGTWRNEYGSLMTLAAEGDALHGIYVSSTGSSGTYPIMGFQGSREATPSHGQPVALAVSWHSLLGGRSDASWQWSSGLSGQISATEGGEVLTLSHLLIASTEFPGLANAGIYLDKLTYRRASNAPALPLAQDSAFGSDPSAQSLGGVWRDAQGPCLRLEVTSLDATRAARLSGTWSVNGEHLRIAGFANIPAPDAPQCWGLSLTLADPAQASVACLAGVFDADTESLRLFQLRSAPTAADATYLQTAIGCHTLTRDSKR